MESTEQWQYDAGPAPAEEAGIDGGAFATVANTLQDHSDRLTQLAEACRASARELAEREQAVSEAFAELDRRRAELDNWKRELEEMASRASQAEARIAEAAEREAALRAVAESVLSRYAAG